MSTNVDESFLGHWQQSQRGQQAMRRYLAQSALPTESIEGTTLNLIADALLIPPAGQHRRTPPAHTAAFTSDDR